MIDDNQIRKEADKEVEKVPAYSSSRELQRIQIELLLDIRNMLKEIITKWIKILKDQKTLMKY